jgi:hypothetical protein
MAKSYKPEVQVHGDTKWYDNALRFATKEEAEEYAKGLIQRWTQAEAHRVSESDEPPNFVYEYQGEDQVRRLVALEEDKF